MGPPSGWLLFFVVLYVLGTIFIKDKGIRIYLTISLIVYLIGKSYFFSLVKEASTHGNTVHGWYSSNNTSEQLIALLWVIGFPILSNIAIIFFSLKLHELNSKKKQKAGNKKKEIVDFNTLRAVENEKISFEADASRLMELLRIKLNDNKLLDPSDMTYFFFEYEMQVASLPIHCNFKVLGGGFPAYCDFDPLNMEHSSYIEDRDEERFVVNEYKLTHEVIKKLLLEM